MIKKIAVYLGARYGNNPIYQERAYELGKWLAERDIDLVYGGSEEGLMKTLADGVIENGGIVHGVITEQLQRRGAGYDKLHDLQVVKTMDDRKFAMMEMADAMLAFPGGVGTLEEIVQCISWTTLGNNQKPVAFDNFENYYDYFQKQLQYMSEEGFFEEKFLEAIYFSDDYDKILEFMNSYQVPAHRVYNG